MRTRPKFISEILTFSLKHIKRLELKVDPFHPNANNVREFYHGATDRRPLRTNLECFTKAQVVADGSDPIVTVQFQDNHKLVINCAHLESGHIAKIIKQFEVNHKNEPEDV